MLRTSVLVFFILVTGIAAKPLKPWNELSNEAVQKALVSIDDKGMASWGEEVEPPEDMDETSYDIEPSMKIWKSMQSEQSKQYQMAEDDLDELQHPSTADLLKAQVEDNLDTLPAADMQPEDGKYDQEAEEDHPLFNEVSMKEAEPDWDKVYHSEKELDRYLSPLVVGYEGETVVRAAHSKPEEDEDDLYHADADSHMVVVPLEPEARAENQGRLYMEPEEDMDDIYHKDIPELIPYSSEAEAAAVDWPSQRKYTEPEEDLDGVYHD